MTLLASLRLNIRPIASASALVVKLVALAKLRVAVGAVDECLQPSLEQARGIQDHNAKQAPGGIAVREPETRHPASLGGQRRVASEQRLGASSPSLSEPW